MKDGDPVNAPIWWVSPDDKIAQKISDEFMLGDTILSAPVIKPGETKRDVYLPEGNWRDGNDESKTYTGPIWVRDYEAPLNILPYFIKQ